MQYEQLMSLAKRDTNTSRAGLIEHLANLYLDSPNKPSEAEAELFGDITSSLMKDMAADICSRVAERLSHSDRLPHKLAMNLARSDRSEVYTPILSRSSVFSDDDLVQLIGELTEEHSLAVVSRPELSEAVTDALIDTGYSSVQQQVSSHGNARISQSGLERLMEAAVQDEVLRGNLVSRSWSELETNSSQFFERLKLAMLKALGPDHELAGIDVEFSPERIADYTDRLFSEFAVQKNTQRDLQVLVSKIREGVTSIDDAVVPIVRRGGQKLLVALIAELLGIPPATVRKAYTGADSIVFSMLCHALNMSVNTYGAVTDLRIGQIKSGVMNYHSLMGRYRSLERRESQRMVRIIKLNADEHQS